MSCKDAGEELGVLVVIRPNLKTQETERGVWPRAVFL